MPLVEIHKARRRIRKPEWQDVSPDNVEQRDAYRIAAKHEDKFARAFMALTRGLLTPEIEQKLLKELREGTPEQAVNTIPWFNPAVPETKKLWERLAEKMQAAYGDVITETGQAEYKREKIPLKFDVTKQKQIPVVPINPFSLEWIQSHSSELIAQVSDSVKQTVRNVILRGFSRGVRAEAILPDIRRSIGLLQREEIAVQNRLNLMLGEGVPFDKATARADRYAEQLHRKRAERIARTETISAQSRGRRDAWQVAVEQGQLPTTIVREWSAATGSPITCEVCSELHGQQAKIGESYYSEVLGRPVEGPGMEAHPQCRCTEILRRVEE